MDQSTIILPGYLRTDWYLGPPGAEEKVVHQGRTVEDDRVVHIAGEGECIACLDDATRYFGLGGDWRGSGYLVEGAVQREGPHRVTIQSGHAAAISADCY